MSKPKLRRAFEGARPTSERASAESLAADAGREVEAAELQPGDTYLDGPYLVFTAQFHLRRGFCCNSDCRHCPYRDSAPDSL